MPIRRSDHGCHGYSTSRNWVLWAFSSLVVQHGQAPRLNRIQAPSTRGVRACICRVAGCATPTGSAGHAGATTNLKLTFEWTTQRGPIIDPLASLSRHHARQRQRSPTAAILFVLLVASIGVLCAAFNCNRGWVCADLLVRLKSWDGVRFVFHEVAAVGFRPGITRSIAGDLPGESSAI
jgi:hypothetical protein